MANTYDFSGRVGLITGGASGIGAATAARLLAGGARVAVLDRATDAIDASARALGGGTLALTADVTRSAEVTEAVQRVERELGRLDILVCCAGISGRSLATVDVDDEEWERVLAVNLTGTFWCNRAVAPGMVERGYGRIINVASMAGKEGNPMAAAYSAAKAGVIGVTKSIGKDLATTGVLVNCVAPAPVETPMLGDISPQHIEYMLARVPMGRLATVEEASTLIAFLASEDLSFSTGATFDLSGGRAVY